MDAATVEVEEAVLDYFDAKAVSKLVTDLAREALVFVVDLGAVWRKWDAAFSAEGVVLGAFDAVSSLALVHDALWVRVDTYPVEEGCVVGAHSAGTTISVEINAVLWDQVARGIN